MRSINLPKVFSRDWTILGYDVSFVFRYKGDDLNQEMSDRLFKNEYKFGIFYNNKRVVKQITPTDSIKESFSKLVPSRMLGMDLVWCKFWFSWDKDALNLEDGI